MNNIEKIREACIKANPSILIYHAAEPDNYPPLVRGIRLADVLLAIGDRGLISGSILKPTRYDANTTISLIWERTKAHFVWNLRQDSLEAQSPETLEFIANLLHHE